MIGADVRGRPLVECGSAGAPIPGEAESGDVQVIAGFDGGVLLGVIDGLGHGAEAAAAAREAAAILQEFAGEPPGVLVGRCHEALRKTRGAVMSVASIEARGSSMTWLGVGNVEAFLLRGDRAAERPRESITLRGGVVGYQVPALRPATLPVSPGDVLVMATDGIRGGFVTGLDAHAPPQRMAESIMARSARGSDDALVLVARYLGGGR